RLRPGTSLDNQTLAVLYRYTRYQQAQRTEPSMSTATPDAKRGTVDLAILATLEHHARYGLEILEEVQRATDGALTLKEGSLYPALHRLVKQGWVESRWEGSDTGGAPRKYYDLTNDGRTALERKRKEWREVRDAMEVFLLRGYPS